MPISSSKQTPRINTRKLVVLATGVMIMYMKQIVYLSRFEFIRDEAVPVQLLSYQTLANDTYRKLSSSNALISGLGTQWERLYAKAHNPGVWEDVKCKTNHRAYPYDEDGISVGPKLCSKHLPHPYRHLDQRCARDIWSLDSYKMVEEEGRGVRFFLDPLKPFHHANFVHDRERHSSASGVVFMGDSHFAIVSFALSILYVYHFDSKTMRITLLDKIKNEFRGGQRGGEFTELVDFDGKDLLVCGNLRTKSFTLFRWDWTLKKLSLIQGTFPFPELKHQMSHGVRFYPSSKNSHVVATTAQFKKFPESLAVRFFDWKVNETKAELLMSKTPYARHGPQDVFFIDKHNMLVAYTGTGNGITTRLSKKEQCRKAEAKTKFGSHLVHYRLHFDLDENIDVVGSEHFEQLQSIHYPYSHPDSISYNDGIVVMSDQYNDHVTWISVDPSGTKNMTHIGILTGYHMNHGVALSPNLKYLAVTQYGDNSVILNQILPWLEDRFLEFRATPKE